MLFCVKKKSSQRSLRAFCVRTIKKIFSAVLRMTSNSHIEFKIIREADTFSIYSLFTFTYYLIHKFRENSEK